MPRPHTAGRRHAVFEGFYVVDVHVVRFIIAQFAQSELIEEAFFLVNRIVELREGVGVFVAFDEELIPVGEARDLPRSFWPAGKFLLDNGRQMSGCSSVSSTYFSKNRSRM